jgi:pyruvate carboxylase
VAARPGQRVARGEGLVTIEAMKMETHVIAERDGMVAEVYVVPGDLVGPRDLLILLS